MWDDLARVVLMRASSQDEEYDLTEQAFNFCLADNSNIPDESNHQRCPHMFLHRLHRH